MSSLPFQSHPRHHHCSSGLLLTLTPGSRRQSLATFSTGSLISVEETLNCLTKLPTRHNFHRKQICDDSLWDSLNHGSPRTGWQKKLFLFCENLGRCCADKTSSDMLDVAHCTVQCVWMGWIWKFTPLNC